MARKFAYKVLITWSEEDDVYIARVPELDGVVTHGDSIPEAAQAAQEAIELHIESLKAHGEEIPEPAALQKLSGKYPLRMGKERHIDAVIKASTKGVSLNEYLCELIDKDTTKNLGHRSEATSKRGKKKAG